MNGLYPGPATAPGANLAGGNPFGPGTSTRVGPKFGAPAKFTTPGPNGLACVRIADRDVGELGGVVDAEVVCQSRVGGVQQHVPDLLGMRGPAVGDSGVPRQQSGCLP